MDGRAWSTPELLTYPSKRRPQHLHEFIRYPRGFVACNFSAVATTKRPDQLPRFSPFSIPLRENTIRTGFPRFAFDDAGGCHAVIRTGMQVSYSYGTSMVDTWRQAEPVAEVSTPAQHFFQRLVIDGKRAALIFVDNGQTRIRTGKVTDEGPIEFLDERASEQVWTDMPMFRDGDRLVAVVGAPSRQLQILELSELFGD